MYVAVMLDLSARRVVGWSLASTLERTLGRQAMKHALDGRQPSAGLLHHTDRGRQYASSA